MEVNFFKYQGAGNDFIMIDDRSEKTQLSNFQISWLCNRRLGIGADGIILLRNHKEHDFEMVYYNSDGSQSFCGNGSRCSIAFAEQLSMISNNPSFMAIDGVHQGRIEGSVYATHMKDVKEIIVKGKDVYVDTGSPHYIKWVEDVDKVDVLLEARLIRNSAEFIEKGTNVNFASEKDNVIHIRTYERGVEDETLSCGTGVTAVALAANYLKGFIGKKEQVVNAKGGELKIRFEAIENGSFKNVWLIGPAERVFEGRIFI